jgi:hypothetical protein
LSPRLGPENMEVGENPAVRAGSVLKTALEFVAHVDEPVPAFLRDVQRLIVVAVKEVFHAGLKGRSLVEMSGSTHIPGGKFDIGTAS